MLFLLCLPMTTIVAQEEVQEIVFEKANLRTVAPVSWKFIREDGTMELHSTDKAILITFMHFPEQELEMVLSGLDEMMQESIKDLRTVNGGEMVQINELDIMLAEAKGTMDGVDVQVGTFLIRRETSIMLILGLARSNADAQAIKGLDLVIGSLQAIEKG